MVMAMKQFVLSLGLEEYAVSLSTRDQRTGTRGERLSYWGKDCDKTVQLDEEREDDCLTFVDVDYHVSDLGARITGTRNPVVIATIAPTKVAKTEGEATYFFTDDNRIDMRYSGGAHYNHELWDYTPDTIMTSRTFFGIPWMTTVFRVEKRQINDTRALVCLAPMGTWRGIGSILARIGLSASPLERLRPVKNGWSSITTSTKDGLTTSVGKAGTHMHAEFTGAEWERVVQADLLSSHDANVAAMACWLGADRERAQVAASWARANAPRHTAYVTDVNYAVEHVSSSVNNYGDGGEEKTTVHAFMAPLVVGMCYSHNDTSDNAKWGVQARITDLKKVKLATLSPFALQIMSDFVSELTKDGPIVPCSFDDLWEAQSRPTQRTILTNGAMSGAHTDTTIRSFLKKEAVAGPKDPRVISTIEGRSKVDYSMYMRAVGKLLAARNCYAFKTPTIVADEIASFISQAPYALEGDFSRMDGNVDKNIRTIFETSLLRKMFPNDDHVLELHKEQYNRPGVIKGHRYEGGYARASGSAETSPFNTVLTMLVAYARGRLLRFDHESSMNHIGMIGGDDSLVPGFDGIDPVDDEKALTRAARMYGQTLTSKRALRGEPVTMLSRVFGGAWYGENDSIACPLRVLAKVHASPNLHAGVPLEEKCYEKGMSMLATDANTPIIGDLARKMITVGGPPSKPWDRAPNFWASFAGSSWPNVHRPWMLEVVQEELGDFEYGSFATWIASGKALEPPTCLVIPPKNGKIDVLVNGFFTGSSSYAESSSSSVSGHGAPSTHSNVSSRVVRGSNTTKKSNKKKKNGQRKANKAAGASRAPSQAGSSDSQL
jgi:hypothetical protein